MNNIIYRSDYCPYEIRITESLKQEKQFSPVNFRRILRYSRGSLREFLLDRYGRIPTGTPIDNADRKQQGITFVFKNKEGSLQRDYLEVLKNFQEPVFLA